MTTNPFADWVGRQERREETLAVEPAQAAQATLDLPGPPLRPGDALPPLWHWFHFLPRVAGAEIGPDGHPRRGGFLPPVELPRRMFAGARLSFHQPLILGRPAARTGTIHSVSEKRGASGSLAFVTVGYSIEQDGRLCLEEEQDIVYREPGAPVPAPVPAPWPDPPAGAWSRTVTPDPVLLFRFSALTFNAHRIHYDRPYAMGQEGYPGLVVHGPLTALLLLELVRGHSERPVTGFSFRGRAPLFDLAPFRLLGRPDAGGSDDGRVELEAHGPDGTLAMTASAQLA
jgi:3-methylfumaryl-CoA hydratase